jgi:hypothetical protein
MWELATKDWLGVTRGEFSTFSWGGFVMTMTLLGTHRV